MTSAILGIYNAFNGYLYGVPSEEKACPENSQTGIGDDRIDIKDSPTKIDVVQALGVTSQEGEITADFIKNFTKDINYLLGKDPQALLTLAKQWNMGNYGQIAFGAVAGIIATSLAGVAFLPAAFLVAPAAAKVLCRDGGAVGDPYCMKKLTDFIIECARLRVDIPKFDVEVTADEILSFLPPIENISRELQIELQAIAKSASMEVNKKFDRSSIV